MADNVHFRSRFFTKEEIREKEDWLNEHFNRGYAIATLTELETGYFAHLIHDPAHRLLTRARFFHRGMEESMDAWLTSKHEDEWRHDIHAVNDGYWVVIYRQNPAITLPASKLLLIQCVELWWLWLIGTLFFALLYFTK
ncbi:hypothetical protein C1X05_13280 [Laceyella sacchari]|uniref:DUF2812 domain-containing protein n=1 Tax=Laceyella tengchongensis TaxID=574699 RepID=A0AA45WMT0_9BACL|nr:hypothetical protein [Laceyella tengchongensis]AUS09705.1 hypothetical protein C1X05_13280 [Laceyella sacchari]SMP14905.1 hypothetical protein SAMN06265361_102640 [Laceyella tengchongensis]